MQKSVLILSSDPLVAGLLGAAIELENLVPLFADASESPRDALRRLRPRLVLVDCQHGGACTDSFLGPAMNSGLGHASLGPWVPQSLLS